MEKEQFCPICLKKADSPHHIKARSQGGTDDNWNIAWLCKSCHDMVEERQEKSGKELSPDMITEMRRELHVKLGEENGVSESYIFREGHSFMTWGILPNGTKVWINQWVDGEPESYRLARVHQTEQEQERERKQTELKETAKAWLLKKSKIRRGRPEKELVDTSYIEELVYNKGLSYRNASKQLYREGFRMTYRGIGMRIKKSSRYKPLSQIQCKHCSELFTPKKERQVYCGKPCNLAHRRHKKELLELRENIDI